MKKIGLFTEIIKRCALPFASAALLAIFYGTYIAKVKSALEINWNAIIEKTFFAIAVMIVAYWIRMISIAIFNWYASKVAEKTDSQIDDEFIPLFKKVTNIIIWAVGIIAVLSYLGINITALITTLGVGSLAIALAAQDTIANVIAGFLIMIDRPFKVGDKIKLPTGENVTVLRIGNRRSQFKDDEGALYVVPNVDLSKSKIVNYSTNSSSRLS
jgi:small-conductance mechanosensitive channel